MIEYLKSLIPEIKELPGVVKVTGDFVSDDGPVYIIKDVNDDQWRMGPYWNVRLCPFYTTAKRRKESQYKPDLMKHELQIEMTLRSFYHRSSLRTVFQIDEQHRKQNVDLILAKMHYKFLKKVIPREAMFHVSNWGEDHEWNPGVESSFRNIASDIIRWHQDDKYSINVDGVDYLFEIKYECRKEYGMVAYDGITGVIDDLKMGLFLDKSLKEICSYIIERYKIPLWITKPLSQQLEQCPANYQLFPIIADWPTGAIMDKIMDLWKNENPHRNKTIISHGRGPRQGSNWTGD